MKNSGKARDGFLINGIREIICLMPIQLHPFTQIQITDKGLDELAKIVETVRGMVGYDIPLSTDHYGHFDLNNGIRLGKSVRKIQAGMDGRYCIMGIN